MANFVMPEEATHFVMSIRPFRLFDVGSSKWFEIHEMVIKLSQQAVLEASEHREENIKELLILHDKLKVLIHESYCILVWKHRVLPYLLEIDPNPQASFLIYTVLFHEAAAVTLLDVVLFHASACEALQDSALDLIDYSTNGVAQVIGLASMGYHENKTKTDVDESVLTEFERHKRDLIYKIGMRCISILSYLVTNVNSLPFNASRRIMETHDVPSLMCDLLDFRPWERKLNSSIERYEDEKWVKVTDDNKQKLAKQEAQTWMCLHQTFFNSTLRQSYDLNQQRRNHFSIANGLLNESILDQLPPLLELKQFLCHLGVTSGEARSDKKSKAGLVLEEVATIKESIITEAEKDGGFDFIAKMQEPRFLLRNKESIFKIAQRLNAAYNTDLLAELELKAHEIKLEQDKQDAKPPTMPDTQKEDDHKPNEDGPVVDKKCALCSKEAVKRCGKCKSIYYCSRMCQNEHWIVHKAQC